jgi:hypothetical protein
VIGSNEGFKSRKISDLHTLSFTFPFSLLLEHLHSYLAFLVLTSAEMGKFIKRQLSLGKKMDSLFTVSAKFICVFVLVFDFIDLNLSTQGKLKEIGKQNEAIRSENEKLFQLFSQRLSLFSLLLDRSDEFRGVMNRLIALSAHVVSSLYAENLIQVLSLSLSLSLPTFSVVCLSIFAIDFRKKKQSLSLSLVQG